LLKLTSNALVTLVLTKQDCFALVTLVLTKQDCFKELFETVNVERLRVSTFLLNKYDDDERTFSSRFHA